MKTLLSTLILGLTLSQRSFAVLLVEDIPNLTQHISAQIQDYAKYIQMVLNQVTQIEDQVTQLERFGDPQYYVNLLGLNQFFATVSELQNGIGEVMLRYRIEANGLKSLGYTGSGLYSNLQGTVDRWGQPVNYDEGAFRKFGAINSMVDDYNTQENTYNTESRSLQEQLATAMRNLNSSKDLVSTVKYAAQVNAINAQMNALGHTTHLTGQRMAIQQGANQNDAARVQEAQREQEIQEREEDLQMEARGFSNLIGGGQGGNNGNVLP